MLIFWILLWSFFLDIYWLNLDVWLLKLFSWGSSLIGFRLVYYLSNSLLPCCGRLLCRNAKAKCESVLGIVGLQWPEDSDCSQFPEEGGNATCLLPEAGVDGTKPVVIVVVAVIVVVDPGLVICLHGNRVLPKPLQVPLGPLRPGEQTLWRTPGLRRPQRRGQLRWVGGELTS